MNTIDTANLLVAEDDPDDQWLIRDAIMETCPSHLNTRFVSDGVELMEYLREGCEDQRRPGLIILDLNMPRKDGRTALREIKTDPQLAKIPIIILTTSQSEEDAKYCQRFGVEGYYHKPGSITELENIFDQLCSQYYQ